MATREPDDARERELQADAGVRSSLSLLRRNRDFRRLFLSSVISLGGDWFLFVAITGLILETTGKAIDVGLAILAQQAAFFRRSPIAGVLADRLDRRKLMIGCDLARAAIVRRVPRSSDRTRCGSPTRCSRLLSVFSAPFEPASSAAIPNVVDPEDLPTANASSGSLWGTMLAVGAALGGVVSTVFGRDTAFVDRRGVVRCSRRCCWRGSGGRSPRSGRPATKHPKMLDATVEVRALRAARPSRAGAHLGEGRVRARRRGSGADPRLRCRTSSTMATSASAS